MAMLKRTFIIYLFAGYWLTVICTDLSVETTTNIGPENDALFNDTTGIPSTPDPSTFEEKGAGDFLTTTEDDAISTTYYETSATTSEKSALVEEGSKKVDIADVEGSNTTVKNKPVQEPPFIKKYWPLLCFKTICDRRHQSPVIPSVHTDVVRTDIEEARSSDEVLRAIESEIIDEPSATTENSSEEDDIERQRYKIKSSVADDD
ncbi:Hypothetical protein NTJ_04765 [Nesidiocoris tenuis]|uniref:Uncharacterized protein n=1 Tax=Nesidiocoris tenuis TaxID=355587 RepID=A0ABN7ANJ4_9HEMI|nr:Hypothetical protein NTJ_04765 [Nesidiocoris tenuis]